MNTFIRLLYAVLIAAAVVTFVSVGIYTFYPAPKAPDYPQVPAIAQKDGSGPSQAAQQAYDTAFKQYQQDNQTYSRNISIIGTGLAVIIVAGGLYVRRRSEVIGEGLTLGGIATSVYGIATAVVADDRVMRFAAVTVFLASAIVVVYVQFNDKVASPAVTKKSKKR